MIGKPAALLAVLTMALTAFPAARPVVCDAVHAGRHAEGHMGDHDSQRHGHSLTAAADTDGCHGLMQCGIADAGPVMHQDAIQAIDAIASPAAPFSSAPRFTIWSPTPPPPRS